MENGMKMTEFKMGEIVFLKSNPSNRGAIVKAIPGMPEYRYLVFIDNKIETYYSSQLQCEAKAF
jgi:hypothetical protein